MFALVLICVLSAVVLFVAIRDIRETRRRRQALLARIEEFHQY